MNVCMFLDSEELTVSSLGNLLKTKGQSPVLMSGLEQLSLAKVIFYLTL